MKNIYKQILQIKANTYTQMPNKRLKTEQVSIDCSIHPVWTHLSLKHWHFKILSSVDREIKMRFSAHTNRKISIGQTQFAFDGENASLILSWSFLINLRTSEKAKLFEHFYPFSWILSRWHWWCCSSRGNPGSPQTSTFPLETKRCQINFLRSAMTKFPRILKLKTITGNRTLSVYSAKVSNSTILFINGNYKLRNILLFS